MFPFLATIHRTRPLLAGAFGAWATELGVLAGTAVLRVHPWDLESAGPVRGRCGKSSTLFSLRGVWTSSPPRTATKANDIKLDPIHFRVTLARVRVVYFQTHSHQAACRHCTTRSAGKQGEKHTTNERPVSFITATEGKPRNDTVDRVLPTKTHVWIRILT
ncbi:hypothetical protein Bbelb_134880 [Branchiostoma belcheri]|nr:hypothetical protein Bbelb_134880 [Branchiostoma belcheri]